MRYPTPVGRPSTPRTVRPARIATLAGCMLLLAAADAWAYVDPGSGSVLLQVLIAGILAVGFTVKGFWGTLKRRVLRIFSRSSPDRE